MEEKQQQMASYSLVMSSYFFEISNQLHLNHESFQPCKDCFIAKFEL